MKITVDLPVELLSEAKKLAAGSGTTVRALFESALRRELSVRKIPNTRLLRRAIRWVTSPGGVPPGMDISNRAAMYDKLSESR